MLRLSVPVLTFAPAVLVLSGFARLLLRRCATRVASLAWLGLLVAWVVMLFGDLFELPQWLQDLSPFEHLALVPLEDFRWAPFLVLLVVALAAECRGPGRLPQTRHPLIRAGRQDDGMWQPEPGWHRTARRHRHRRPSASGGPSSATARWSSSGSARPREHDPAELQRPAPLRVLAARRRRRHRAGPTRDDAGAAGARLDVGRGGRRRDHPRPGLGRGRRQQRPVRRARRWAGSPAPTWATTRGWRGTSSATGWRGSSARGGWPTLARTTVADVADHLWQRRGALLDELDALPQVAQHGDPAPANLPGRDGDDVVAIDWGTLGRGPVGADLGLFMLGAREEFEPLLDAYLLGLPDGLATRDAGRPGGPRHRRAAPRSPARSGRWPGSPAVRARWPGSTGTRPWRRTCGRCSGSSRRSRRWSG